MTTRRSSVAAHQQRRRQRGDALAATGACALPRLVVGSARNIKLTYAADLALAAAVLSLPDEDT